jgi:hypothetical protein
MVETAINTGLLPAIKASGVDTKNLAALERVRARERKHISDAASSDLAPSAQIDANLGGRSDQSSSGAGLPSSSRVCPLRLALEDHGLG